MRVRKPFFVVLLLILSLFAAAYISPQQSAFVFYRAIMLALAIVLVAVVWAFFSVRGLSLSRNSRVFRQQVGQIFEERVELRNLSWYSRLWVEVKDKSALPNKTGSRVLSSIGPHQQRSYFNRTLLTRRGAFLLGPNQLLSGDPFGMFSVEKTIPGKQYLVVLPYFVDLDRFIEPPGKMPGGQARRRKTMAVTPYAAGIRDYAPGDALNRIHWKTTARKDRLMVKEFEEDPQADVWIVLDAQSGIHLAQRDEQTELHQADLLWMRQKSDFNRLPDDSFEYCVSAAASIAKFFLDHGRPAGFICAGQNLVAVPAERGERQLAKILETLAFLNPEGKLPIDGLVESQSSLIPRGSTVVVITASNNNSVKVAHDILLRKDLRPVFVFADPRSFGAYYDLGTIIDDLAVSHTPFLVLEKGDVIKTALEKLI
jgi:uncharacterized protein (DUF58 family)